MQAGTVSRLRFCGRSWGLKIHIWRNVDCFPSFVKSSHQEALLFILWRQGSSDQDGCERKKPDDETCFQDPHSCSWLVSYSIEVNLGPTTEISHVMSGTIFCVCSTSSISVPSLVLKRCPKEHNKMTVKEESRQIRSRWWIWSRDTAWGSERACLDCIGKPEKKSESQNVLLSSLNEQQTRTRKLVMGASSSNCSEWNTDENWSSQEWKSGEMWEQERRVPSMSSLSSMMIWTLAPPQNWTVL